jgi:acyl-[acyl-carrier-protein]-phospholipid O-acyltransferase/long-chain-fatty-acid--[acyl-carrier-protein] ligase
MSAPDLSLLGTRRFAPLFVVQFLGAFNDNLLKFALLFLANFGLYAAEPGKAAQLATIATGLFILPYFLFSALAGQIADACDKAKLVVAVKVAEIVVMLIALIGFRLDSVPVLLGALFLMGVHSTIFGPVKYAILPQHLGPDEIVGGTGVIEAGTFLAILGGQLLASMIAPWQSALVASGLAVLGLVASLAVPSAPPAARGLAIDRNPWRSTRQVMGAARRDRRLWLAILGISWFFSVGAVLLSEFAPLVSDVLGGRQSVATLFLLIFSVSVALGSVLVNTLLGGKVSARYVPAAALVLGASMIDLWWSTHGRTPLPAPLDVRDFLAASANWRILVDLAGIAIAGGIFVVPLYAILQTGSTAGERSRVIAANNIVNAIMTVAMVGLVSLALAHGVGIPGVIGALGALTLPVALLACGLMPDTLLGRLIAPRGALTPPKP